MGLGLTTQMQRQVGTQIVKLIIFGPPRVNLNKRNTTTTGEIFKSAWGLNIQNAKTHTPKRSSRLRA